MANDIKTYSGLIIDATICPDNLSSNMATHDSLFGKGGWKIVDTIAERNSILTSRRTNGMAVYVTDVNKLYILSAAVLSATTLTDADWFEFKSNEITPSTNLYVSGLYSADVISGKNTYSETIDTKTVTLYDGQDSASIEWWDNNTFRFHDGGLNVLNGGANFNNDVQIKKGDLTVSGSTSIKNNLKANGNISGAAIYANGVNLYQNDISGGYFKKESKEIILKRNDNTELPGIAIDAASLGLTQLSGIQAISARVDGNKGYISLKLDGNTLDQTSAGLKLNLNVTSGVALNGNNLYGTIDTSINESYLTLTNNGFAITGINTLSTNLHNYDITSGSFNAGTLTLSTVANNTIKISGFETDGDYLSAVNPSGTGTFTIDNIKATENISGANIYSKTINTNKITLYDGQESATIEWWDAPVYKFFNGSLDVLNGGANFNGNVDITNGDLTVSNNITTNGYFQSNQVQTSGVIDLTSSSKSQTLNYSTSKVYNYLVTNASTTRRNLVFVCASGNLPQNSQILLKLTLSSNYINIKFKNDIIASASGDYYFKFVNIKDTVQLVDPNRVQIQKLFNTKADISYVNTQLTKRVNIEHPAIEGVISASYVNGASFGTNNIIDNNYREIQYDIAKDRDISRTNVNCISIGHKNRFYYMDGDDRQDKASFAKYSLIIGDNTICASGQYVERIGCV